MKVQYEITERNITEIAKKFKVLGNPKHLKLLLIINDKSFSLDKIHDLVKKYDLYLHRESTYKALEKMVEMDIIEKKYDKKLKKFYYYIN